MIALCLIAWIVSLAILETIHTGEIRMRDALIESQRRDLDRARIVVSPQHLDWMLGRGRASAEETRS